MSKLYKIVICISCIMILLSFVVVYMEKNYPSWGEGHKVEKTQATVLEVVRFDKTEDYYSHVEYYIDKDYYDKWFQTKLDNKTPTYIYYDVTAPKEKSRLTDPVNHSKINVVLVMDILLGSLIFTSYKMILAAKKDKKKNKNK